MADFKSIGDFLFNRPKDRPGIFRSVPGRFPGLQIDSAPVRIVNEDNYGMSQNTFTLVAANTEYTIQGISTLAAINLKARGGSIQVSIYEGQSGTIYSLLEEGQSLEVMAHPFGKIGYPVSLYIRTPTARSVLEIIGLRLQ